MSENTKLDLRVVQEAVSGSAAAFRCVTKLQPTGGVGDKIFPPTYEKAKYAVEERVTPEGDVVKCVLLDSVQSQANRMEIALLDAVRAGSIKLPLLVVNFDDPDLKKKIVVTSLEAPHRVADAIFRDSMLDGVMFRESEKGKVLDWADLRNAAGLFGLCPTALLFGIWDSTGPRGGQGAKFQRAIVSEIVGYHAEPGVKTSSRIDPLQVTLGAGPLYQRNEKSPGKTNWTLKEEEAAKDNKNKAITIGKEGKPSEANHGNITPTIVSGGFTIGWAKQTTVLSLAALRRLHFPINRGESFDSSVDNKARTVIASLGIVAATLARKDGLDLRSRCQLFPTEEITWELLGTPGSEPKRFCVDETGAVELFEKAVEEAKECGLPWEGEIALKPSDTLLSLLVKSQELAASLEAEES